MKLPALLLTTLVLSAQVKLRVQSPAPRHTVAEIPLERYVAAVLAGESSAFTSREALKAMAVAARTYGMRMRGRHASEGFDLCSTTHCQRVDESAIGARLIAAAHDTLGEYLTYAGQTAFSPYSRDCGGHSEDAGTVWPDLAAPYLKSHDDPYCSLASHSTWTWSGEPQTIVQALRQSDLRAPQSLQGITVLRRTAGGRAQTLLLEGGTQSIRISASSFRFGLDRALGWDKLRGDQYDVRSNGGQIVFSGKGAGHGVGLCQLGAEQMGLAGRSYREILSFYYPGTQVAAASPFQKVTSAHFTLVSTETAQDQFVLTLAERMARKHAQRTGWPVPQHIEIRVYPSLTAFRDTTGEPGWVAAHTESSTIHLQPVKTLQARGALESTLSHEILHAFVESQATRALPIWFREGIVAYMSGDAASANEYALSDVSLRQRMDETSARKANRDAASTVSRLVHDYGETAVLDWVRRGVPAEVVAAVTNASAKPPAVKSK